jgi:hypothetical protein
VRTLGTVVWSTGGVGANAIDAISRRPDLELVGVWVHSPDKVGPVSARSVDEPTNPLGRPVRALQHW